MKGKYNLRIRPPKTLRRPLVAGASDCFVTYRTYIAAVLTKAAEKKVTFDPPQEKKLETQESRILLDEGMKSVIRDLAKQSGRTPEEWAIEVLKMHDKVME